MPQCTFFPHLFIKMFSFSLRVKVIRSVTQTLLSGVAGRRESWHNSIHNKWKTIQVLWSSVWTVFSPSAFFKLMSLVIKDLKGVQKYLDDDYRWLWRKWVSRSIWKSVILTRKVCSSWDTQCQPRVFHWMKTILEQLLKLQHLMMSPLCTQFLGSQHGVQSLSKIMHHRWSPCVFAYMIMYSSGLRLHSQASTQLRSALWTA